MKRSITDVLYDRSALSTRFFVSTRVRSPFALIVAIILLIAKSLAVPLAEVAVIGDGGNDVAMFEWSS